MQDRRFTLLIADDEAMILRGLADSIPWDSIGVKVVARAADGLSALHSLETLKPDIAIVDICMPLCDGLSLIEKAHAKGLGTVFIILSGYDDFPYAQRAIKCGASAYLLKPINKQELLNTVSEQCARLARHGSSAQAHGTSAPLPERGQAALNQLITDIALQTGFGSSSHFISSFRRAFGISPNVYRSDLRSGARKEL